MSPKSKYSNPNRHSQHLVIHKQPPSGANIVIVGANIGTSSDENGYYFIKNVTTGKYTLRSSMIW